MADEQDEYERALEVVMRRECADGLHQPARYVQQLVEPLGRWVCRCGDVTWVVQEVGE